MVFTLNHEEAFEGNAPIIDGTYEVFIEKAFEDATKNGAEYINFWLRIRNDIKQKSQNQVIFHRIWKGKETGKYHTGMINTLGKAAQLPNGKSYNSMEELLNDFIRKPLKVTVKNETSEYNGKTYENLNVKYQEQTEFTNLQHRMKESNSNDSSTQANNNDAISISDSDLPF